MNNRRRKLLAALLAVGMATSLTACGTATSDTPISSDLPDKITSTTENEQTDTVSDTENTSKTEQTVMDFSVFTNVTITGTDISALSADEQAVLYGAHGAFAHFLSGICADVVSCRITAGYYLLKPLRSKHRIPTAENPQSNGK